MLLGIAVYPGPNVFSRDPLVQATLDRTQIAGIQASSLGASFGQVLVDLIGSKVAHPNIEKIGTGDENDVLAGILQIAIDLQQCLGSWRDYGLIDLDPDGDSCRVLFGYDLDLVGTATARMACRLVWDLAKTAEGSQARSECREALTKSLSKYRGYARSVSVAFSTKYLTLEAKKRDIPFRVLPQGRIQYGHGIHQRQSWDTYTDRTSLFGVRTSSNKAQTNAKLRALGLPTPRQVVVSDEEQAVKAADAVNAPVVLKPLDAHQGNGVSVKVSGANEIRDAFRKARKFSSHVIVEQLIAGDDHRLLVVDGRLIAAAIRVRAHVVGDGSRSIADLITEANKDPRRGEDHDNVMTNLTLDASVRALLQERGYTADTVPPADETVYLSKTANIATGGSAIDVTDVVHDDNRRMAIEAATAIGLDIAGIDYLTRDISRSYRDIGGGICEINCTPGLTPHYAPLESRTPPVAGAIVDYLYRPGSPSRVPIVALLAGAEGPEDLVELLSRMLKAAKRKTGVATRQGYAFDGVILSREAGTGPEAALSALADPRLDTAVFELSRQVYLKKGLGFDACSVAAILGTHDDDRADRRLAEIARDALIVDADDPATGRLSGVALPPTVLVATRDDHPVVRAHVAAGNSAVVWNPKAGAILLHSGNGLAPLAQLPGATDSGGALRETLFAAAIAWSLGLDQGVIAATLSRA